jgi:hypothetical protein
VEHGDSEAKHPSVSVKLRAAVSFVMSAVFALVCIQSIIALRSSSSLSVAAGFLFAVLWLTIGIKALKGLKRWETAGGVWVGLTTAFVVLLGLFARVPYIIPNILAALCCCWAATLSFQAKPKSEMMPKRCPVTIDALIAVSILCMLVVQFVAEEAMSGHRDHSHIFSLLLGFVFILVAAFGIRRGVKTSEIATTGFFAILVACTWLTLLTNSEEERRFFLSPAGLFLMVLCHLYMAAYIGGLLLQKRARYEWYSDAHGESK